MKSNDYILALLLETDLFSLAGDKFRKITTYKESGTQFVTVEAGLKRSKELFRIPLVT